MKKGILLAAVFALLLTFPAAAAATGNNAMAAKNVETPDQGAPKGNVPVTEQDVRDYYEILVEKIQESPFGFILNPTKAVVTNAVVAEKFERDGDLYRPAGNILFEADRRKLDRVSTLYEINLNKTERPEHIFILTVDQEMNPVSADKYTISGSSSLYHITSVWNIANKEAGAYHRYVFADRDLIGVFGFVLY